MRIIIVEGLGNNGSQFENKGENAPLSQKDFQTLALATVTNPTKERITELASYLNKDNVNARLVGESAILHIAVMYSSLDRDEQAKANRLNLINMLITKGADLDMQGPGGNTALHYACFGDAKSMEIAQNLVRAGASPTIKNNYEDTALSLLEPEEAKQLQASKAESKPTISQFADNARAAFEETAPKTNNQQIQTKRDNMGQDRKKEETAKRTERNDMLNAQREATGMGRKARNRHQRNEKEAESVDTPSGSENTFPTIDSPFSSRSESPTYNRKGVETEEARKIAAELEEKRMELASLKRDLSIAKESQKSMGSETKGYRRAQAEIEEKNTRIGILSKEIEKRKLWVQEETEKTELSEAQKQAISDRNKAVEERAKANLDSRKSKAAEHNQAVKGKVSQVKIKESERVARIDEKNQSAYNRAQAEKERVRSSASAHNTHVDSTRQSILQSQEEKVEAQRAVNEQRANAATMNAQNIREERVSKSKEHNAKVDKVLRDKYISNPLAYKALECAAIVNEVKGNIAAGKASKSDLHKAQEAARASMIGYLCDVMQNKVNVVKDEVIVEIANNYQRAMGGAPTPYKQALVEMVRQQGMEAVEQMPGFGLIAQKAGLPGKDFGMLKLSAQTEVLGTNKTFNELLSPEKKTKYLKNMEAQVLVSEFDNQSKVARNNAERNVPELEKAQAQLKKVKSDIETKLPKLLTDAKAYKESNDNPKHEQVMENVSNIMANFEPGVYKVTIAGQESHYVSIDKDHKVTYAKPVLDGQKPIEAASYVEQKMKANEAEIMQAKATIAERKEFKAYRDGEHFAKTSEFEIATMNEEFNRRGVSDIADQKFAHDLAQLSERATMMSKLVETLDNAFSKEHVVQVKDAEGHYEKMKVSRGQIMSTLLTNIPADDLKAYVDLVKSEGREVSQRKLVERYVEVLEKHAINNINLSPKDLPKAAIESPLTLNIEMKKGYGKVEQDLDSSNKKTFKQEADDMKKGESSKFLSAAKQKAREAEVIYKHVHSQHKKTPLWQRMQAWMVEKGVKKEVPQSLKVVMQSREKLREARQEMLGAYRRVTSIENKIETAYQMKYSKVEREYAKGREREGMKSSIKDTFNLAKRAAKRALHNFTASKDVKIEFGVKSIPKTSLRKKSGTGLGA